MFLEVPDDGDRRFPTLGPLLCDWIEENLVFGPGDLRGQPAILDPDKRALIWRMYEVFPKGHTHAGRRRFKRVGISLPKGLAKTEMAAWIAAAELHPDAPVRFSGEWVYDKKDRMWMPLGCGVIDPYIPMVAYTEEQSDELAYGALKAIIELSDIREDFDIGIERIARLSGGGKAVSLSSSPSGRDGARTTFAVMDETHWWTLPRLKQAHQTMLNNLPKRKLADPWMLEITTAPEPGTGSVAEATMDYALAVREGKVKDSTLFYFHRQASDSHDLTTIEGARAAVIEASGPAAAWRDIDAIVGIWNDPSTDRSFWERVWCNRLVQGARQAFDVPLWKTRAKARSVQPNAAIVLGFDGSIFHDATALVATEVATGHQWKAGLWECPPGREKWEVPTADVDAVVREMFAKYNVWAMYADPAYWQSWLATWTGLYGADRVVHWWTTRRKPMKDALENYSTAIRQGTVSYDGDPDFDRHLGNARRDDLQQVDEQGKPMWLIRKERPDSPHKIDLAMAAVLSWEARTDAIAEGIGADTGVAMEWV